MTKLSYEVNNELVTANLLAAIANELRELNTTLKKGVRVQP